MKSKFGHWKFLVGYWIFSSILALAPLHRAAADTDAAWPQVQGGPAHTGYVAASPTPPFEPLWIRLLDNTHNNRGELIHSSAQIMTDGERAFVGTWHENAYALDMETGEIAWQKKLRGPVMSSCALDDRNVYFTTQYGLIYALNKTDGETAWEWRTPDRTSLWASPCLANGKMYIGARNGVFYCFDCATGKVIWEKDIGAPIAQTAAMDNERVYFGAEDMRAYCLDAGSGETLWRTEPFLGGQSFSDYWPVVGEKVVIFSVMPSYPYALSTYRDNFQVEDGLCDDENWRDLKLTDLGEKIRRLTKYITNNRQWQTTFVLDKKTGKESFVLPILYCSGSGCTQTPPAIHADGTIYFKYLFTPYGVSPGVLLGRAKEDGTGIESLPGFEQIAGCWGLDALRGPDWKKPEQGSMFTGFFVGDQPLVITLSGRHLFGGNSWVGWGAWLDLDTLETGGLGGGRKFDNEARRLQTIAHPQAYECTACVTLCAPYVIGYNWHGIIICLKSTAGVSGR